MTPGEAKQFFDELFVAFPHLKAYLSGVDNPQGTFDAWKRLLGRSESVDARAALSRILDGHIEVPTKPWEIGVLGNWSRSVIGRVTDDRRKRERQASTERHSQEAREVKDRKPKTNFRQAYRIAIAAGACKKRGDITPERNQEIMNYVYAMQSHHETEDMEIPDDIRQEYDNPSDYVFSRP